MKLEASFLHSKLARRIFWLFVVCAMVPVGLLGLVSLRDVMAQMNEQSRKQLRQVTVEEAMEICRRLALIEGDLQLIGEVRGRADAKGDGEEGRKLPANLTSPFRNVEIVKGDGQEVLVYGRQVRLLAFTKAEEEFLGKGHSVLSTKMCDGETPCIFLSRQITDGRGQSIGATIVGELDGPRFWDAENLPSETSLCVLDAVGRTLFCSGKGPHDFPPEVTKNFSAEFETNQGNEKYLTRYWNIPLAGGYYTPHWTVVGSRAKVDMFAPFERFRTSYLLVALLSLWIVALLSVGLIRRNLVPLGKLKEGTREIAAGNYRARVSVTSKDEFEELASSFNSMAGRIEKQMNSLKVANEIDRAILSAWGSQKVVTAVLSRIGDLLPVDLASITLIDHENSLRASTYVFDPRRARKLVKHTINLKEEELAELVDSPDVWALGNGEELPSFTQPLTGEGMKGFLCVPILFEGKPMAVMTVGHASESAWSDEDKQNARELGDQAGVALSNSQLLQKLHDVHWGALSALARAIDAKSPWTLGHSERVTDVALRLAREMGIAEAELEVMRRGGLLHDIGKIGVPAEILDKPGKLTPEELKQMREHVNIGVRILQPIPGFADAMPIVAQHHEWINGAGYPNGLKGDEITLHARIFAVADCYDALISDRPYRSGLPVGKVVEMIREGAGRQFDPQVVQVFERVMRAEGKLIRTAEVEANLQEV